ncbi:MAG TPA: hypothetical protein VGD37_29995 [Kofleriaceae bacterium]|jgi:hypothetical protein
MSDNEAKTEAKIDPVSSSEIESLNADDLDIEELEHRIELASTSPDPFGWICGVDINCPNLTCGQDGVEQIG